MDGGNVLGNKLRLRAWWMCLPTSMGVPRRCREAFKVAQGMYLTINQLVSTLILR